MIQSKRVYLEKRNCFSYPDSKDYYSPHVLYPEYPFPKETLSTQLNEVYDMVRTSLYGLGLDREHYGSAEWNPLGDYVQPNAYILIKPNFVTHKNTIGGLDCTVTHPSIIRCIIDYCVIAGAALIEIGDAPIQNCNFKELMDLYGYNLMFGFIREKGINIRITDFRRTISKILLNGAFLQERNIDIDTNKTCEFDLKDFSHFNDLPDNQRYRIANYYDNTINRHHNKEHHKYLVAKSILDAELIINLPKPKTHRFAGITGAQKNFIGICSDKEYLPHYRTGVPEKGGDETNRTTKVHTFLSMLNQQRCKYIEKQNIGMQLFYMSLMFITKRLRKIAHKKQCFSDGQWYGNDTIWRTILDLNLILLYGNSNGALSFNQKPRNILSIGDMIVAGEKSGPLEPSPKPLGMILASDNCAAFDYVFCKITGFDYRIIPTVKNSIISPYLLSEPLDTIKLYSNNNEFNNTSLNEEIKFPSEWNFTPNPLWNDILARINND
jgi:uncharacterized protein (DUF362 family)